MSTGTFLHNALVFFRVFVKVHNNITIDTTLSNLSAIVAGTWKVGIDGVFKYLSPNTKIEFRKLLATVHGLPNRTN